MSSVIGSLASIAWKGVMLGGVGVESTASLALKGVLQGGVAYANGRPSPTAALLQYGVNRAAYFVITELGSNLAQACKVGGSFCEAKIVYGVLGMGPGCSAYGELSASLESLAAGEDCNNPWVVASSILTIGTPIIALLGSLYIGKKVCDAFHLPMNVQDVIYLNTLTGIADPIANRLLQ